MLNQNRLYRSDSAEARTCLLWMTAHQRSDVSSGGVAGGRNAVTIGSITETLRSAQMMGQPKHFFTVFKIAIIAVLWWRDEY